MRQPPHQPLDFRTTGSTFNGNMPRGKSDLTLTSVGVVAAPAEPPAPTFARVDPVTPQSCPLGHIFYGPPVSPEQHIKGYSDEEFELFIREWAFYHKQVREKLYTQVGRFGGAGDMGRDVVGYTRSV
jgi:hypothetical protein